MELPALSALPLALAAAPLLLGCAPDAPAPGGEDSGGLAEPADTAVDPDTALDVVTWNIETFPKRGPSTVSDHRPVALRLSLSD